MLFTKTLSTNDALQRFLHFLEWKSVKNQKYE